MFTVLKFFCVSRVVFFSYVLPLEAETFFRGELEQFNKAKIAARKIPKIRGMEQAGDRFIKYADEEIKKRRSRKK